MKKTVSILIILVIIIAALIVWYFLPIGPIGKSLSDDQAAEQRMETTGIPEYYLAASEGDITDEVEEYKSGWRIHFFNVGQGDAVLIQDEQINILIDGGDRNSGIINELQTLAIDTIHWMIATHPHADHIAGLVDVLEAYPVLNILDPGVSHSSALYRTYREKVSAENAAYTQAVAGWSHSFTPDFSIQVVHPNTATQYDINNSSLVLRVKLGQTYALFVGDAEHEAEEAILRNGFDVDSDIIKVGHHGSKTSSSDEFIAAVSPDWGVIHCGKDNKYDFPHSEALAVYQSHQTHLFRSDIHGDVLFLVNDSTFTAYPEFTVTTTPDPLPVPLRVNINSAGIDSLMMIVHVGETTARRIIENRPYTTLDDLQRVRGLGPARVKDIKEEGVAALVE